MKLFTKKRVELGQGHIVQYTIFESKRFGGIWLYNFKEVYSSRLHTHAYPSISILLKGSYIEQVLRNCALREYHVTERFQVRKLPINYCHRIISAKPNTWSLVVFGKWSDSWWELFPENSTWMKYSWNRKEVLNTYKSNNNTIPNN